MLQLKYVSPYAMQDEHARELMVEAAYYWGALCLLLDVSLPSIPRERAVVAFIRLSGGVEAFADRNQLRQVLKLCKGTGYSAEAAKPPSGECLAASRYIRICTHTYMPNI